MDEPRRALLRAAWASLGLSADLGEELLQRWDEPHRHYHGPGHLQEALEALDRLGGGRAERLALWFHDAVFTSGPDDEAASAALASARLGDDPDADEVARLVLLTRDHAPRPDDEAGARVCDADLWILGAEPDRYAASVRDLRAEQAAVPTQAWALARLQRLESLLAGPIYHTPSGRTRRRAAARRNLATERAELARWAATG